MFLIPGYYIRIVPMATGDTSRINLKTGSSAFSDVSTIMPNTCHQVTCIDATPAAMCVLFPKLFGKQSEVFLKDTKDQ